LLLLCQTNSQLLAGPRSWSSLFKRAFDLGRTAKWNEFIEEQKTESVRMDIQTNRTKSSQSLIDETKDPDSPYYISMISSNIGGGHQSGNRTIGNNKRDPNGGQPGLVSKLFNYAFSNGTPSRVMQTTTKQPLVTYINVSSLEEHDSENGSKLNSSLENTSSQLQLLNNADPSTSAFHAKRRLPECAAQQVCAAHYVKSNHTQRLCECQHDFNWNCEDATLTGEHTIDLTRKQDQNKRNNLEAYTQVKLCENLKSIKPCKTPTDWTIMALQSERTGKAHYVVVCKCPDESSFEGPFTHKHPPYARFPGIRVYGMLCNQSARKSKDPKALEIDQNSEYPEFPWELAYAVINATTTQGFW